MSAHPARGVSTGIGRPGRASQRRVGRFAHALQSNSSTSGGWIFPCDPQVGLKVGRILDLYERRWQGIPLGPRKYVLCADEKTSIQARRRRHPSQPPAPGRSQRVEHEYTRAGAWAYIAAWDVHRARVFGRCEVTTGIVPFDRLVAHVMRQEPYRSARRVRWP